MNDENLSEEEDVEPTAREETQEMELRAALRDALHAEVGPRRLMEVGDALVARVRTGPHRWAFVGVPPVPEVGREITETERARFLRAEGYAKRPSAWPLEPTEFVDWCLARGYCPHYLREPETEAERAAAEQRPDGKVLERYGDRERIDAVMRKRGMVS